MGRETSGSTASIDRSGLRTDIPRHFARTENRLHDAGINRVDLPVAVHDVLAEVRLFRAAERGLYQTRVHRVHLPVAVYLAIANPLRIARASAARCGDVPWIPRLLPAQSPMRAVPPHEVSRTRLFSLKFSE